MIFWVNNTFSVNPQLIAFFWFTIRHILHCALSTRCALANTEPESRFMWENCGWRSPRKQGRGGCLIAAWELGPGDLRHCAQPCKKTRENELELRHCHHRTRGLRSEVIAPDVCSDGGKKEMKSGDRWRPVGGLNGSAPRTEVVCSASWRQIQSRGGRCSQYALVHVCVRACTVTCSSMELILSTSQSMRKRFSCRRSISSMMRRYSTGSTMLPTERAVTCQLLATADSMMACRMVKPARSRRGKSSIRHAKVFCFFLSFVFFGCVFRAQQRVNYVYIAVKERTAKK